MTTNNLIHCYDSRKKGGPYPSCCKNKDCDETRKKLPYEDCDMVFVKGVWIDNYMKSTDGKRFSDPLDSCSKKFSNPSDGWSKILPELLTNVPH